jgi:hypothetical protein
VLLRHWLRKQASMAGRCAGSLHEQPQGRADLCKLQDSVLVGVELPRYGAHVLLLADGDEVEASAQHLRPVGDPRSSARRLCGGEPADWVARQMPSVHLTVLLPGMGGLAIVPPWTMDAPASCWH